MSTIGADVEQMQNLAQTLGRVEQDVDSLARDVTGAINNTWWKGSTHDRLQQAWQADVQPSLNKLREILQQSRQEVQMFSQGLQDLDRR